MSISPFHPRYKLIFFVPPSSVEICKYAIFETGAGQYPMGKYSMVSFESSGTGQFMPGEGARPNIGTIGELERVNEVRVEILCVGRDVVLAAVEALKGVHPYEEVAYEVYKCEDV